MKLKKSDWMFILVAGTVIGVLVVLSVIGKKAQPMSIGPHHAGLNAQSARTDCLKCHDPARPDAVKPLSEAHPLVWKKDQVSCTTCHAAPVATHSARLEWDR